MSPAARDPTFGLFLIPTAESYPDLLLQAATAERAGLDLIGIQDHPYQRRFVDTFALIGDLLARTERLTVFPDVACLPLRPAATLAKLAASLDTMSGGRFELGMGAGAFWDGVAAMGGPRRSPGESVDALEEAIEIVRRFWSGERTISFEGRHYQVNGLHPGPAPAHEIGIWVGAYKPRMLDLTGRLADGWLPSYGGAPPEAVPEMTKRIEEGAAQAGRDPDAIRRLYNISGQIVDGPVQERLKGPSDHWVETLTGFVLELGFDTFVFWPSDDVVGQIERFGREVAPGVREAVAAG
ncbi:MAG TPA: LLM class flavin-dependent oxidoreductase [Thermoleophilaceae bacterium]|nr:LLM class flavin-dependent oxidoreductase [Thermoleophilaceae bacterium]